MFEKRQRTWDESCKLRQWDESHQTKQSVEEGNYRPRRTQFGQRQEGR